MNNYSLHDFQSGQILRAQQLNSMDSQIDSNADNIDIINNANKTANKGQVWTATDGGAQWKDSPASLTDGNATTIENQAVNVTVGTGLQINNKAIILTAADANNIGGVKITDTVTSEGTSAITNGGIYTALGNHSQIPVYPEDSINNTADKMLVQQSNGNLSWEDLPPTPGISVSFNEDSTQEILSITSNSADTATLNKFTPATQTQDGITGLVPAPTTQDNGKFLCADGTWQTVNITDATGDMLISTYASQASKNEQKVGYVDKALVADALNNITIEQSIPSSDSLTLAAATAIEANNNSIVTSELLYQALGNKDSIDNTDTTYILTKSTSDSVININLTDSDNNVQSITIPKASYGTLGLIALPDSSNSNSYLNGSGQWSTIENTGSGTTLPSDGETGDLLSKTSDGVEWKTVNIPNYSVFTNADESNDGTSGLVPAPQFGQQTYYLRADGWQPISSSGETSDYVLPKATSDVLGGIYVGSGLTVNNGTVSVDTTKVISMPTIDDTISAGQTLVLNEDKTGLVWSTIQSGITNIPTASSTTLGGIKIGSGLIMTDDVASVNLGSNLTVDTNGAITIDSTTLQSAVNDAASNKLNIPSNNSSATTGQILTVGENGSLIWADNSLPIATKNSIGAIQVGANLSISNDGLLDIDTTALASAVSTAVSGKLDVPINVGTDGQIITLADNQLVWADLSSQSIDIPIASNTTLGGIKVGDSLSIDASGVLNINSTTLLGKQDALIYTVSDANKVLSVNTEGQLIFKEEYSYTLPTASANTLGGVKISEDGNITIDASTGVISANLPSTTSTVTQGSEDLITSGGVFDALQSNSIDLPSTSDDNNNIKQGQVLTVQKDGTYTWEQISSQLPQDGEEGQLLGYTNNEAQWIDQEINISDSSPGVDSQTKIWINTQASTYTTIPNINDTTTSLSDTWSSSHIKEMTIPKANNTGTAGQILKLNADKTVSWSDGLNISTYYTDTESQSKLPNTIFNQGDLWLCPSTTTTDVFDGATSSSPGTSGLVPAPSSGETTSILCSNGNWIDIGDGLTIDNGVLKLSLTNAQDVSL